MSNNAETTPLPEVLSLFSTSNILKPCSSGLDAFFCEFYYLINLRNYPQFAAMERAIFVNYAG